MSVKTFFIPLNTAAGFDIADITGEINKIIQKNFFNEGSALIFCPGATGGVTTIEYETGLEKDLKHFFQSAVPEKKTYFHNERWGDGNGHSHIRASLLKPDLTVPVKDGEMILGTWQQVIFVEFDVRARKRNIVVQLNGEFNV